MSRVQASPPAHVATWLDGHTSGYDVGHALGFNEGHIVGFDLGFVDGCAAGRAERDAEFGAWLDTSNKTLSRTIAASSPYDELAERRGEPARAARQREILRERGIAG